MSQRCVSWRTQCQHVPHTGVIDAMIRSPGRTRDTAAPVHSTIPVVSCPSMIGPIRLPSITAWSEWHTPVAVTRTTTSRSDGRDGRERLDGEVVGSGEVDGGAHRAQRAASNSRCSSRRPRNM